MKRDSFVLGVLLAMLVACGSSDRELDIAALTARDLLELSPEVALAWSDDDRAEARALFARAASDAEPASAPQGLRLSGDDGEAILASLLDIDARRLAAGDDALITGRIELTDANVGVTPIAPPWDRPSSAVTIEVTVSEPPPVGDVDARALAVLGELALRAGHDPASGPVWVGWVEREPFAALYVAERRQIWVNPNYLAALEPAAPESAVTAMRSDDRAGSVERLDREAPVAADFEGNPYSFYGSVAECAAAERNRCESCLAAASCEPTTRDAESGAAECATLAEDGNRGFHLLCANLALAMATVSECVSDSDAACVANRDAGNQLAALEANASFVDDPQCGASLDGCLADIFGEPEGDFPGPMPDGGPVPEDPPQPPRDVDVACSDNSADCDVSPDFGCSSDGCSGATSCGSCDSGCDSDDGSGGGGSCDAPGCEGGGCDGTSCDGCDSGSDGGGSDGGDSCGGSCGGGDCAGGTCNGESCGSGSSGSSSSQCTIAKPRPAVGPWVWAMLWAMAPIPLSQRLRRRERRRRRREGANRDEVAP